MSAPPAPHSAQSEPTALRPAAHARGSRHGAPPAPDATALRHGPSSLRFAGVAVCGLALDLWSKHWAFHSLGQGHQPQVIIPRVLEFRTMLNSGALFGIGGGQTVLFLVASACALLLVFWMFSQTSRRRWALQIALGAILAGALGNMYDRVIVRLVDYAFPHGNHVLYTVRVGEDEQGVILKEYPPHEDGAEYRMRAAPNPEDGVIVREYPRGGAVRLGGVPQEAGFVRDFIKIPTRWFGGREVWPWVFNVADMLLVGGVAILAIHLWRDRKHRPKREGIAVDSREAAA